MTHRTLPTAWFVVLASLTAPSYAAEPEFKAGLVTESRTYYREECCVGGESCDRNPVHAQGADRARDGRARGGAHHR